MEAELEAEVEVKWVMEYSAKHTTILAARTYTNWKRRGGIHGPEYIGRALVIR